MITPQQFYQNIHDKYYEEKPGDYHTHWKEFQSYNLSIKELSKIIDKLKGIEKKYYYMVTFTLDPKKVRLHEHTYIKAERYIRKLLQSKTLSLDHAWIVKEGGDEEHKHTHWHCSVISDHCIKKDRFKTYLKNYGRIDVSKTTLNTNEQTLLYMSKQDEPEQLF